MNGVISLYQGYPYYYYYPQHPHINQFRQQNEEQSNDESMLPMEESYIENILRLNKGKTANVHMTFPNESKTFTGVIEAAGRDHIILSDSETGRRYLLLMVYLDYVSFSGEIDYQYPYNNQTLANYPPR